MKRSDISFQECITKGISLLCLFLILGFSEKPNQKERIEWKGQKLVWADFKALPDKLSPQAAVTSTGIEYKLNIRNDSISINVVCYFRPDLSWVKNPTNHLLNHEQLHFDITEYYKRNFEQQARALIRKSNSKDFPKLKTAMAELYKLKMNELYNEQELYDQETNSSRNIEMQNKWRKKYNELLGVKF